MAAARPVSTGNRDIPERPATIRRALSLLKPYAFGRVYGGWWRRVAHTDGAEAVRR
ncbi:hypothetical protein OIE13_15780 [Streptosporangium sp. NBC_01810]|uniref:hypothetical protein n=1 Tax=Streptosporangium sp. NBC_01810 TaxID=2975951 RepID=UPI002DDA9F4A|nr:hypothetical protein [Streptosporangium sp. NBC_01810]WSA29204.1 hypothetical protein OIE13_15780 [Streptosporangium sp. NBC_01810]